jgi:hypothetical protein
MTGSTHELGQVAYEAYANSVNWTAYNGERIQDWADQDPARCAAWSAAAESVASHVKASVAGAVLGTIPATCRARALECVSARVLGADEDTAKPAALTGCSSSQSADAASCDGGTCDGTGTLTLSEPPADAAPVADAAPAGDQAAPELAQSSDTGYATGGTVPAPAQSSDSACPASSAPAAE